MRNKVFVFVSGELDENSVVRNFRTTVSDGKMHTQKYYILHAIIAVGFKANSQKEINFRAWAADVLAEFAVKGYVLDMSCMKARKNILFTRILLGYNITNPRELGGGVLALGNGSHSEPFYF